MIVNKKMNLLQKQPKHKTYPSGQTDLQKGVLRFEAFKQTSINKNEGSPQQS